jgi:hypothetical protein
MRRNLRHVGEGLKMRRLSGDLRHVQHSLRRLLQMCQLIIIAWVGGCTGDASQVRSTIRASSSWDAGARQSIQELSRQLNGNSRAEVFRVYWRDDETGHQYATLYMRHWRTVGYEDDPGSGFVAEWTNVDESTIHLIASKGGSFDDFGDPSWCAKGKEKTGAIPSGTDF